MVSMKIVEVAGVKIGSGIPKVIVPLVEKDCEGLLGQAEKLATAPCQIVEWRLDYFDKINDSSRLIRTAELLKQKIKKPLLITLRTKKENGYFEGTIEEYYRIYQILISHKLCDLIDLEFFIDEDYQQLLIKAAKEVNIKVILSNHDFEKTPAKTEIMHRLRMMEKGGADICKIAVMPQNKGDVLTLLNASYSHSLVARQPFITMAMGQIGKITRLSGQLVGSAATFASLGRGSAPGQLDLNTVVASLKILTMEN